MARRRRAGKGAWHNTVFLVGVGGAVAGLAWLVWRRRGGQAASLGDGIGSLIEDVLGIGGTPSGDAGITPGIGGGRVLTARRAEQYQELRNMSTDDGVTYTTMPVGQKPGAPITTGVPGTKPTQRPNQGGTLQPRTLARRW